MWTSNQTAIGRLLAVGLLAGQPVAVGANPRPGTTVAPQPGPLNWGALRAVQALEPAWSPNRIDPQEGFLAYVEEPQSDTAPIVTETAPTDPGQRCSVWGLQANHWLGFFPAKACAWPRTWQGQPGFPSVGPGLKQPLRSPDGALEAVWEGAQLSIRKAGEQTVSARYAPRCPPKPCPPLQVVRWAPDGQQLALAHENQPLAVLWDVRTGQTVAKLPFAGGGKLMGQLLAFGSNSIVAVSVGVTYARTSDESTRYAVSVARYSRSGAALPTNLDLRNPDHDEGSVWSLDPNGRFLFREGAVAPGSFGIRGFDLSSGRELAGFATTEGPRRTAPAKTEGRWYPGARPLYETLEAQTGEGAGATSYHVWRIHTGSTAEELWATDDAPSSPPPDPCRPRRVAADGRSLIAAPSAESYNSCDKHQVDPSGRWEAAGKDRLVRVSDRTELIVPARRNRCTQTADGIYNCLATGRSLLFLAGEDPRHLVMLRGDQLMPLLFRPSLLADYVSGAPLQPAKDTPIGRPPTLELVNTDHAPSLVRLRLRGAGVDQGQGMLRIFGDRLTEQGQPRPLADSVITEVEIPAPTKGCPTLSVYYCNPGRHVCSLPVEAKSCSPGAPGG